MTALLVLLIPLACFLSYCQARAWERRDLRRQVEHNEWQRARRATGERR